MKFKVLLVIPARFGSTRLPGKPLKKIGNKTMIQRVYERAKKVNCSRTIIATDDKRILNHCLMHKMNCMMTKKSHMTGSDRVSPWTITIWAPRSLAFFAASPISFFGT